MDTLGPYALEISLDDAGSDGPVAGRCMLRASRWGFEAWEREVELRPAGRTELDLVMRRDPLFPAIVAPRLTSAVTRLPGESFTIELDLPPGEALDFRVELASPYFSRTAEVRSAQYGADALRHGTEPGWMLDVALPPDIPEELYDLVVSGAFGVTRQPNAVQILAEIPRTIYVAGNFHHVFDSYRLSTDEEIGPFLAETINVIHPVLFANVDDVGYEDERVWGRIAYAFDSYADVPYVHGLGNHDRGGVGDDPGHYEFAPYPDQPMSLVFYRYYAGMRYQARSVGSRLHVILPYCPDQWQNHYRRPDQDAWLKAELARHRDDGLSLLVCHHLTWHRLEDGRWRRTDLLDEAYGLDLVLLERGHRAEGGRIRRGPGPTFYGGLAKSPNLSMVGVLEITALPEGDSRPSGTLIDSLRAYVRAESNADIDPVEPAQNDDPRLANCDSYVVQGHRVRDCTLRALDLSYSGPNNGTMTRLTARVQSPEENPITIQGGRLKFAMARGRYTASRGAIVQQVDSDDGEHTIVYVRMDVPPGETVVTVAP